MFVCVLQRRRKKVAVHKSQRKHVECCTVDDWVEAALNAGENVGEVAAESQGNVGEYNTGDEDEEDVEQEGYGNGEEEDGHGERDVGEGMHDDMGGDDELDNHLEVDEDFSRYEPYLSSDEEDDSEDECGQANGSGFVDEMTLVSNPRLVVGLEFTDNSWCRRAIREYAINKRFNVTFVMNNKMKIIAKCATPGCPWRCYARVKQDRVSFSINSPNYKHICTGIDGMGEKAASMHWVAE